MANEDRARIDAAARESMDREQEAFDAQRRQGERTQGGRVVDRVALVAVGIVALGAYFGYESVRGSEHPSTTPSQIAAATTTPQAAPTKATGKPTKEQIRAIYKDTNFRVTAEVAKFDKNKDFVIDGRDWVKMTHDEKREATWYATNGFWRMMRDMDGNPVADDDKGFDANIMAATNASLPILDGFYGNRANKLKPLIDAHWKMIMLANGINVGL